MGRIVGAVAVGLAVALSVTGAAWAEPVSGVHQASAPVYQVTFAARSCDDYGDIMANRARNNHQESLRDLGKDSVYRSGQPVEPDIEQANNGACRPLTGWRFTLGSGFNGYVDGLTTVSGPDEPTPETVAGVPLLDRDGRPTGGSLAGAVTAPLTQAQLDRAIRGRLTMQAGTPTEPLLGGRVPGGSAFGTLRCSVDNVNADNVEYVGFPTGYRHVFCFAYYIDTRVPEGMIVVRKQLTAGHNTETFGFNGNVSYARGGRFELEVKKGQPAETRFTRAATRPGDPLWKISEDNRADWALQSLTCSAPGGSQVTVTGGQVSIRLVAGDTVTCTYLNKPPTVTGLVLRKTTSTTTGTFHLNLTGQGVTRDLTLTTARPGLAVSSEPLTGLPAGTHTLTETVPDQPGLGPWRLESVECDGASVPVSGNTATLTLPANGNVDCHVRNRFTPVGSLTVNLVTHGGTGTAGFAITPRNRSDGRVVDSRRTVTATTTADGAPVRATGDLLDDLNVTDAYDIDVTPPPSIEGRWIRDGVTCSPPVALDEVTDTLASVVFPQPTLHIECTFVYRLIPPGTLQIIKTTDGDPTLQTGPAVITVTCANGAGGQLVLPAGQNGPAQLPEPIRAVDPTTCTVTETDTGAKPGVGHTLTADLADYRTPTIRPGAATVIRLRNTYAQIAVTGPHTLAMTATGAGSVALGVLLVCVARRRHRAA
ncbi:DUF5979 domain-containing protein [Longispora sp. K20-0274]|uniref:prealbumin-like fold domain-containing protein n=1 Tax=Longispora sp. K20-0274 TaxID=3088255 RepID=UPI00399B2902